MYYLTGFTDEAADSIEDQIEVIKELGWSHLELRAVDGVNAHNLTESEFETVRRKIEEAGIQVSCLGSNIANWGIAIDTPFEETWEVVKRAADRAKRLGTSYVRVMSYAIRQGPNKEILDDQMEEERFRRLRLVTKELMENGLTPVHENCFNYGGMSWRHTLKLLEEVPGLKLAYDTGNPGLQYDYGNNNTHTGNLELQDPWTFYSKVKEHIEYVHIKDALLDTKTGHEEYYFPGEGAGEVRRIVKDLLDGGYEGGFSMEPHMAVVYHDTSVTSDREQRYSNFLEYGRRFMKLLEEIGYPYPT